VAHLEGVVALADAASDLAGKEAEVGPELSTAITFGSWADEGCIMLRATGFEDFVA
jgi:hypothetical protein